MYIALTRARTREVVHRNNATVNAVAFQAAKPEPPDLAQFVWPDILGENFKFFRLSLVDALMLLQLHVLKIRIEL
jgi:hypothetical protein